MRKVLFLDIDGVLNILSEGRDKYGQIFNKHFEDNLHKIVETTGADIVISSTWRLSGLDFIRNMWKERGIAGNVIDVTPTTKERIRGVEIDMWLKRHDVDTYVIIDDDSDMLPEQMPYFIKTSDNLDHNDCVDMGYGLTNICTSRAIEILNK